MRTSLRGKATRESDRRRFSVSLPSTAIGFEGEAGLPPGSYELFLTTGLPPRHASYFARARIDVPCASGLAKR